MIIQFCGLSGAGKTTLAYKAKAYFNTIGINIEVIDGDEYRKTVCKDLGFSKEDRAENIRRLAFIADRFSKQGVIAIICAINPYEAIRNEVEKMYANVFTVFIDCNIEELIVRDTKGLYKKAMLPTGHPEKLNMFTGIDDVFERPPTPSLTINTFNTSIEESLNSLINLISYNKQDADLKQPSNSFKANIVSIRYNTECDGKTKMWRLVVDGKEILVDDVQIKKESFTSSDWIEDRQCYKYHLSVKDCTVNINSQNNKAILS